MHVTMCVSIVHSMIYCVCYIYQQVFVCASPPVCCLTQGPDLEAWEDSENAWAAEASEDLSWEAQATLKEKRRLEREARQAEQQRKKQEREQHKSQYRTQSQLNAVKLR